MSNYKLTIQYDGTDYFGWQVQAKGRTIQGEIESVFKKIFPRQKINLIGAGRTDSGVHALNQVANIKLDTAMEPEEILNAINGNLSNDIYIKILDTINNDFHARFSATDREYVYNITSEYSPFNRKISWHIKYKLDDSKMTNCAESILGEHDFSSFCKATAEVNHKRCTIYTSTWTKENGVLKYKIKANRFLQHMVRFLVGTMVEVGRGRITIEDFKLFVNGEHPKFSVLKAPAQGLFLKEVNYEYSVNNV